MSQYFRELGCKTSNLSEADRKRLRIETKTAAAVHQMARLKIPLEFPKLRILQAKKR
jgi:DNA-directed RNA polymerase I subunit RPA49